MDGKVAPKDEVATVLHLIEGILAAQGDGGAILLGKFGAQDESPIIQPRADDRRTEAIGGGLQCLRVRDGERKALSSLWKRTPWRCSSPAIKE